MKTLITLAAVALAGAALAETPAPMAMASRLAFGGGDPILRVIMNPRAAEKIGLADEQKAKLKELLAGDDQRDIQKKIRAGMSRQMELMKAEKIDEAAVMAAIDEVFEARKEIAKNQTKRLIAVRTILTSEQVAKAREIAESMRARRGNSPRGGEAGPKKGPRSRRGAAPAAAPAE